MLQPGPGFEPLSRTTHLDRTATSPVEVPTQTTDVNEIRS